MRWLRNEHAHASSHFVVSRSGRIVQLVHLSDIAWHAGNWRMNVRSVGIEHEGWTDDPAGFTEAQYRASARLTAYLLSAGADLRFIQDWLGHASIQNTVLYAALVSRHRDATARRLFGRMARL